MADPPPRRSLLLGALAVSLVLVALGLAGLRLRGIDAEATERREQAAVVAGEAGELEAELAAERSSLSRQRAALTDAENDLRWAEQGHVLSEAEHAAALAELEETDRLLASLEAALDGTARDTESTAALVGALGRCLDGVSEVLVQISVGDHLGAIASLVEVEDVCAAAGLVVA